MDGDLDDAIIDTDSEVLDFEHYDELSGASSEKRRILKFQDNNALYLPIYYIFLWIFVFSSYFSG